MAPQSNPTPIRNVSILLRDLGSVTEASVQNVTAGFRTVQLQVLYEPSTGSREQAARVSNPANSEARLGGYTLWYCGCLNSTL